jgi:hypothetical protein
MTKLIWSLVLLCAPMFLAFWVLDKYWPLKKVKWR